MCDSFIISYLTSKEASQIARGISIVEGKLSESNQFQPEDAVQIFPLLIPLLMHIHYKVRKNAFYLFLSILNRYSDYLDSTCDSVPNCLASLICVDEEIAECAHQALEFIFDLDDPKYWWPYCDKVLFNSKSNPQRIKLMFIIYSHFDEIPVIPIIKLLDDPIFTIQKMAYSMLQFNDQEAIQTKLEKYRTLLGMDTNPYELDLNQRQLERYRQLQETIKKEKTQKNPARVVRRTRRARASENLLETRRQAAEETIQDEMYLQGEKSNQSANDHKVHSRFVTKMETTSPIGKRTKGSYPSYDNYQLSPNLTLNPQFNLDPNPNLIQAPPNYNDQYEMDNQDFMYEDNYDPNQQNFNNNSSNRKNNQQSYNQSPSKNRYGNDSNYNYDNFDNGNGRSNRNSLTPNNQNRSPQQMGRPNASPGLQRGQNYSSPANENKDRRYPAPVPMNSQQRGSNSNNFGNNSNNDLFNRSNNNSNNQFNRSNNNNSALSNKSNNVNNNYDGNSYNNGLFSRPNNANSSTPNRQNNNNNNQNNNSLFNRSYNQNANNNGLSNRSNNNYSNSLNNMNNRFNDQSNRNSNMSNRFMDNQNNRSNMNSRNADNQSNRSNNMNNRFNDNQSNRSNNIYDRYADNQNNRSSNMNNRFMDNQNGRGQNTMNNRFNDPSNRSNSNMNNMGNRFNDNQNFRNSNMNNMNNRFNNNQNNRGNNNMNNGYNDNPNFRSNNRFNNDQNSRGANMNDRFNDNPNYRNNNNYDNYGDQNNDAGSELNENMFDQTYPMNQNSAAIFDKDSMYEGLLQQLGNTINSNQSPNQRTRRSGGNGDPSQTLGSNSPSGEPLPFELVDLKEKNWEYRKDYLEKIHKTLSSKKKHYNYRHDYLMDCVMDAAKPPNKRVAIALSKVITDVILEEPGVIEPFLDEITNFMVQSVSQFNSIYQVPSSPKSATKSQNGSAMSSSMNTPRALSKSSTTTNSPKKSTKSSTTPKKSTKEDEDDDDDVQDAASSSKKSATPSKNSKVFNIPTSPSRTAKVVLVSKTPNSARSTSSSKKNQTKNSTSRLYSPSVASDRSETVYDVSAFDELIDAIILEVNPAKLINSMLDYPNRTTAHVELLIQKLYRRRPNLTLCMNDLEKLLTFLTLDAYPLALKLGTIGGVKSQPAYLDAVIFILHKTAKNQPKIYASIISLQSHAGMVEILSKFLPKKEEIQDSYGSTTKTFGESQNSMYNNYNNNNNRNYDQNEFDYDSPPMFIVLRELKKSDDCPIDILADSFDSVSFNSQKHLLKVFLRFLAFLSRISDKKIKDNESDLRRICFNHFNSNDLLSILSLKNVESEILVGLSKYIWFAPKDILNGADSYYENMYRLFTKSTGQARNAIIVIASGIQKATKKSILDLPNIAEPHQKVIEKLLSQYENQNTE